MVDAAEDEELMAEKLLINVPPHLRPLVDQAFAEFLDRFMLPGGKTFLETIRMLAAYEEQIAALVEQKAALSKSLHEAIHAGTKN
jgi:hypothetical protein